MNKISIVLALGTIAIATPVSADDITYPVETLAVSISIVPEEKIQDTTVTEEVVEPVVDNSCNAMTQQTYLEASGNYQGNFDLELDGDWSQGGTIQIDGEYPGVTFDITNTTDTYPSLSYTIDSVDVVEYSVGISVTNNITGNVCNLDPFVINLVGQ